MLAEYRAVLLRPKFGFSPQVVASLLAVFSPGDQVSAATAPPLPDPDDEVFMAAALATADRVLVTGNRVHFPAEVCAPVTILAPAEALKVLGGV
jgi:predicted nucleic acid-binding protein